MISISGILNAVGAAGLLTKLAVAAGLAAALLAGYGVWHHHVDQGGYQRALADIARADSGAVSRATSYRNNFKECRAAGKGWDQTSGECR